MVSPSLFQFTPSPKPPRLMWAFINPTPTIEPISVCELEAGRPNHQVPKFHRMAESSSAKIMAKPASEPTCRISSTGSSATMPKATAPEDRRTPRKFQHPDQTTAWVGVRLLV